MIGLGSQYLGLKQEDTPKFLKTYFRIVQFLGSMCLPSVTLVLEKLQGPPLSLYII